MYSYLNIVAKNGFNGFYSEPKKTFKKLIWRFFATMYWILKYFPPILTSSMRENIRIYYIAFANDIPTVCANDILYVQMQLYYYVCWKHSDPVINCLLIKWDNVYRCGLFGSKKDWSLSNLNLILAFKRVFHCLT